MKCDDCDSIVQFGLAEYLDRKERLGVVLCYGCRRGETPHPPAVSPF